MANYCKRDNSWHFTLGGYSVLWHETRLEKYMSDLTADLLRKRNCLFVQNSERSKFNLGGKCANSCCNLKFMALLSSCSLWWMCNCQDYGVYNIIPVLIVVSGHNVHNLMAKSGRIGQEYTIIIIINRSYKLNCRIMVKELKSARDCGFQIVI